MFAEDYYITEMSARQKFTKYILPWIVFATIMLLLFLVFMQLLESAIIISEPVEKAVESL